VTGQYEVIFWGATGHSKVLRECLKHSGGQLVALFDNNENLSSPFADVPLYFGKQGFQQWLNSQGPSKKNICFLVAIGGDKGKDRVEIQGYLESYNLISIVAKHNRAFVADGTHIGLGTQILAKASVCANAVIGRGCIINTGAIVDHDCILEDGVHICPGAALAGCVHVGQYAMIGTGAVILPRIKIGEMSIVGAGSVVTKDVPPRAVVVGNPARVIREIAN
jgi:sugar O-acyltransferase (sialic acid O-acetyltransferase NeuD family)